MSKSRRAFLASGTAVAVAGALAACGGGSGSVPVQVVASDVAMPVNATTGQTLVSLIQDAPITMPNGIAELGLTGSTTLTFGANNTFTAISPTSSISGTVSYGSITFKWVKPNGTQGTGTISDVSMTLPAAGAAVSATTTMKQVKLTFGGIVIGVNVNAPLSVNIDQNGRIVLSSGGQSVDITKSYGYRAVVTSVTGAA